MSKSISYLCDYVDSLNMLVDIMLRSGEIPEFDYLKRMTLSLTNIRQSLRSLYD